MATKVLGKINAKTKISIPEKQIPHPKLTQTPLQRIDTATLK